MAQPGKTRNRKIGLWLPTAACLLLAGTVWLGFQHYETQQLNDRLFAGLRAKSPVRVRAALDQGASPNARTWAGMVPVGSLAAIRLWLAQALHPDQTRPALTVAITSGNPLSARLLLDRGARPDTRDCDGRTPLAAAICTQDVQIVHLLLDRGASPVGEIEGDTTPLMLDAGFSCEYGNTKPTRIMQMLLDKGADINAHDSNGDTALAYSVRDSGYGFPIDLTMPRFLLMHGAKVDAKRAGGDTLLQQVVGFGDGSILPLVKLLLDHGANVNASDGMNGGTPLQHACTCVNPASSSSGVNAAVVQTLLNRGANPNVFDRMEDMTPLMEAVGDGQIGTVRLMLAKGANVNANSKFHGTALEIAIQQKRLPLVKLLLDHGATPNHASK